MGVPCCSHSCRHVTGGVGGLEAWQGGRGLRDQILQVRRRASCVRGWGSVGGVEDEGGRVGGWIRIATIKSLLLHPSSLNIKNENVITMAKAGVSPMVT